MNYEIIDFHAHPSLRIRKCSFASLIHILFKICFYLI